jgi:exoribonuclease R
MSAVSGLAEQVQLQLHAAEAIRAQRVRSGTLEFESIEPQPLMTGNQVTGLALQRKNRARDLIEDFMIAANRAIAMFLQTRGMPLLQRVLRTPERWPRIVEVAAQHGGRLPDTADAVELGKFLRSQRGRDDFPELSLAIVKLLGPAEYVVVRDAHDTTEHFALAVHDYTHSTAPNRRYPDLIIQRLVKAAATDAPAPYTIAELEEIATHCNERAAASRKLERLMRKIIAAAFLRNRIGETFAGIVTGVSDKGTFVRIFDPPAEGRIVRGEAGLDVGDKIRVKLVATNPDKGFIDFARSG